MTYEEVINKLKRGERMTYEEVLNRLKICVDECDDCLTCKAMEDSIEIAILALEKQIPKKPYKDNENGVYEKEHCPSCHRSLFPNDHHCECGQAIDWEVSE